MKRHTKRLISLTLSLMLLFSSVQISATALFDFGKVKDFTVNITSDYFDVEDYDESGFILFDANSYTDSYGAQLDDFSREIYDDVVKTYVTDRKSGATVTTFSEVTFIRSIDTPNATPAQSNAEINGFMKTFI